MGYEERGDEVAAAILDARLAELDFVQGHPPLAARRMAPALEVLERSGSPADVAAHAAQLGRFLIFTGDYEHAAPYLERALSLAESLDLPETFAQALNSKSVLVLRLNRPREARVLIEGALAFALEHDLHAAALRAHNNLTANLWDEDDWPGAIENLERSLALARRVGDGQWENSFVAGSVGALNMLGRWDEALARAGEAEELAATEFARGLMLQVVAIHCHRGALEHARDLLTRHADIARSENPDFAGGYTVIEAVLLAAEGRAEEALAAGRRALDAHRGEPSGSPSWLRFQVFEAAAGVRDADTIRALLGELEGASAGKLTPSVRAQRARFRARLPEYDAQAELAAAEQLFGALGTPFYVAVAQLERAENLIAEERADEAEPLLAGARETFERLGATPWLDRASAAGLATSFSHATS